MLNQCTEVALTERVGTEVSVTQFAQLAGTEA